MLTDTLFKLPATKQHSKIFYETVYNDIPLLILLHPHFNAIISLQGGQLLHWQPKGHSPVIWLSEKALFNFGSPIRGGIPICWPWFGKAKSPSHGFARNLLWKLTHWEDLGNRLLVNLQLKSTQQTHQLLDNDFIIDVQFIIGQQCEVELDIKGHFDSTAALHSYFYVGEVSQAVLHGLGEKYTDKITQQFVELPVCHAELSLTEETDRIYHQPKTINHITDPILKRIIEIEHHYASDIVVWNPWKEAAVNLDDMSIDGYKTMLCVETARLERALVSTPKLSAKLGCVIKINTLD